MRYQLNKSPHNFIEITILYDRCYIFPTWFEYEKIFPEQSIGEPRTYLRTIKISFEWLFWKFEILLRKRRKK